MAKSETPARDAVIAKYLNEAFGKEKQLETALVAQIALAKRPALKKGLQDHLRVTKAQSRGLSKRIRELGGKASVGPDLPGPDLPGAVTGAAEAATNLANRAVAATKGPVQALRGTSEADNELRNVRDCYWNEAEEIAHYNVIEAVATELGDAETARLARAYRKDEEKMQKLLARQIPQLVKSVVREEVPASERRKGSSSRRSSSARGRSSSGRSGSGSATRKRAAQKAASTRATKSAKTSAKRTASSAATSVRKGARAARSTAKRATS